MANTTNIVVDASCYVLVGGLANKEKRSLHICPDLLSIGMISDLGLMQTQKYEKNLLIMLQNICFQ
jgi:hypothetical protein